MSLKIKNVQYDDVHLLTYHDVDVFTEELRVLIASGYSVSVGVVANSTLLQDCGSCKPPLCTSRRKYDVVDQGAFSPFHYNSNTTKNDSGSC